MRYFLGFFATVLLIILLIILLVHGGSKPSVPPITKTLDSYASSGGVASMLIDGPVNANSQHVQVRITIDRDNARYEQLTGYDGDVVKQLNFDNTQSAYEAFLLSLAHAGFTKGNPSKQLTDERGYCPTGRRYVFELTQQDRTVERYWATSCGKPKTYLGNLDLTITLFQAQVPNYSQLTGDLQQL